MRTQGYEAELGVAQGRWDKAKAKGFDKLLAWDGHYPTLENTTLDPIQQRLAVHA